MKKTAFITGITGQDGSYLADFLLSKGYFVHGLVRRSSSSNLDRISHLIDCENCKLVLHQGDLADFSRLKRIVNIVQPDEIYNLAAMSHVQISFDIPEYTANIDALGALRMLEAVKNEASDAKFYQASSSELFGKVAETPQSETTPFYPRSPYGVSKLYAYWSVVNYREAYNLFTCNGILFNHESPRRGEQFVTRKITQAVAKIALGSKQKLFLGNLDAKRDWGYAKDFVEGMWLILQQEKPEDFVLATGVTTTVRQFTEFAFLEVGIEIEWHGKGVNEKGVNKKTGELLVEVSAEFFRPTEVDILIGNAEKAKSRLGWTPKTDLHQLIRLMVKSDLAAQEKATSIASL
ncbi:MAG: GDP-mannose 4,6-dehydratase [Chlamydiota bacterium]